jgi:polyisoprenoid-binding protein YceI
MTTAPSTSSTTPATLADLSGTYTLDPAHTRSGFVARHAMVTKPRSVERVAG